MTESTRAIAQEIDDALKALDEQIARAAAAMDLVGDELMIAVPGTAKLLKREASALRKAAQR